MSFYPLCQELPVSRRFNPALQFATGREAELRRLFLGEFETSSTVA
jgi:hypothetical protein